MDNQSVSQIEKPKSFSWKKVVLGSCSIIALCVFCGLGVVAFTLWGGGGEPATLGTAQKVDREFLQAIHDEQIDTAHAMLSEKFTPQISEEQLAEFIQKDKEIFSTYKRMDVCDWGFFISDGRVITSSGLLYYEGGAMVVDISLHKDADSVWRVQGFRFKPEIAPEPFGMCK